MRGRYGIVVPMKFRWLPLLVFASSCLGQNSGAPSAGERLTDVLKSATSPITASATGELGDTGGKLMTDAIEHAQFAKKVGSPLERL